MLDWGFFWWARRRGSRVEGFVDFRVVIGGILGVRKGVRDKFDLISYYMLSI